MKKIQKETVCLLGILATIVIFFITAGTQMKDGDARDAGIYVASGVSALLWLLFVVCIVFFFAFWILCRLNASWAKKAADVLLVFLIAAAFIANVGWKISFEEEKEKVPNMLMQHENVRMISLSELETVLCDSEFQAVYIGRDNCPLCRHIVPELLEYLEASDTNILYYNSEQDHETNVEEMRRVFKTVPVTTVPFVMIVDHGEVVDTFMGAHAVEQFKEYMDA